MSLFLSVKRTRCPFSLLPINPSIICSVSSNHSHGCRHQRHFISSSSTLICPSYCEGRLRRQRGVFNREQVSLLNGSSLPLSRFHRYHVNRGLYCSHCQVSPALSPPFPFSLIYSLQEKMLAFEVRDSYSEGSECGFSISLAPVKCIARSTPSSANSRVSIGGFSILESPVKYKPCYPLTNSFWQLPRFSLFGKMTPLKCRGHYRAFSSCDFEEEIDVDDGGKGEDDEEDDKESDVTHKSRADQEEVSKVAKVIDELFALDRSMEAVLDECDINLTHDLVFDVLQRFKHARKPAFRFFCWAGQRPGFSHNSRTYNVMLMILGKTRQFETMGSILEEMGEKGLLTMDSFTIAIKAYASGKERKKAVAVFELMKRYRFKAGVETINCLLDALAREKLAKEAQALYEKLKSRFAPNMKTYSILLSGWCKVKNLMEAGRMWNEMIDQGFKPDVITHNIMLDGLLKVNKKSDAIKLFEVMKAKGPAPNVRSYTILIRDLCKHSKMTEAVAYFDEMLASGCEPDAGVYTCLITGFGNQKKMDIVYGLLREMKEKGHPPDGQLYNALIKLMINRRMPDDAVRVYKKMIQNGILPTIHTYNMVMKSYFLSSNGEMGCSVLDEMVQRGCCPDENSYTVLIRGLIRQGRSEEACKYVEEMIAKGMRVPELDLNKFVADFSRFGRPNILMELAQKMRLAGKYEVSEVFTRWAEMTQKRIMRTTSRDPV